jgi:hypothetical protein
LSLLASRRTSPFCESKQSHPEIQPVGGSLRGGRAASRPTPDIAIASVCQVQSLAVGGPQRNRLGSPRRSRLAAPFGRARRPAIPLPARR